jgi:hypothetical protein
MDADHLRELEKTGRTLYTGTITYNESNVPNNLAEQYWFLGWGVPFWGAIGTVVILAKRDGFKA